MGNSCAAEGVEFSYIHLILMRFLLRPLDPWRHNFLCHMIPDQPSRSLLYFPSRLFTGWVFLSFTRAAFPGWRWEGGIKDKGEKFSSEFIVISSSVGVYLKRINLPRSAQT